MTSEPVQVDVLLEASPPSRPPRELDLFAFGLLLLRHIRFILGCGVVAFLVMVVAMLMAKPRFASTAVMIVPQGNIASARLEEQLSLSTVDLLGGGYELYADMIQSRVVADRLIHDYDLDKAYGTPDLSTAEAILAARTKVETQREGLIRVTVQDTNAERAAGLANDYLSQLDSLDSKLVLSSVGRQALYLQGELTKEKNALADAEVALVEVQKSTNGVPPPAAATAGLSALEMTRAQLRADQVQLSALLTGATEANPQVVRLRSQIADLSGQVQALQHGAVSASNGTPTAAVPAETLEYTRRLRDVKFHEELYDLLEKEFETAQEQEAQNPSIVQMLDYAVPSLHKSWPPRTFYCIIAGIVGTLFGIILVVFWQVVVSYVHNPANSEKLRQLKMFYRKQPVPRV